MGAEVRLLGGGTGGVSLSLGGARGGRSRRSPRGRLLRYSPCPAFGSRGPNPASFPHVSSGGGGGGGAHPPTPGAWPRNCRTGTGLPRNAARGCADVVWSRGFREPGWVGSGSGWVGVWGGPLTSPAPFPLPAWWRSVPRCPAGREEQAACLHFSKEGGSARHSQGDQRPRESK